MQCGSVDGFSDRYDKTPDVCMEGRWIIVLINGDGNTAF